jgi:PAS domain S-box-containing protein
MDGIQAAAEIRKSQDIPVIYLTAYADEKTVERAKITEPSGFLVKGQGLLNKPFDERELNAAIEITLYRHQMEKEHDQISSAMFRKITEAVIATNSTGQIRFINSLAEVLTGWNKTEALGKELEEVFLPLGEVTDESSLEEVLPEKQTPELISRNGSRVTIQGTVTPIKDYKKRVTGLVVVFKVQEE